MVNFPQNNWLPIFQSAQQLGLFELVTQKIMEEKAKGKIIFPPSHQIFRAFELCDWDNIKLVLLGQDPYHGVGEANGLCFSVNEGIRTPPSLKNIFKELKNEYSDFKLNRSSDLSDWAKQGVLLINSVLTVEKDQPASHAHFGWQGFTDYIISVISSKKTGIVFMLLGNFAKSKIHLIDTTKHKIIEAAHPSPFSAHRGFFGSNVFKASNDYLMSRQHDEINWV